MGVGSQVQTAVGAAASAGRGASAVPGGRLAQLAAIVRARRAGRAAGPLTDGELKDIMAAVQRGEMTELQAAEYVQRLQQTAAPVDEAVEAPAAAVVTPPAEPTAARPFSQGEGGRLFSDTEPSIEVRPSGDGETFVYPDGTVVDVFGNVVGTRAVDEGIDNLDASATDLGPESGKPAPARRGGKSNLTPNTAKTDPQEFLAQSIFQMTARADTEPVNTQSLKRLLRQAQQYRTGDTNWMQLSEAFSKMDANQRAAALAALPENTRQFLASVSRDPEEAAARLARLEEMAGVSNADRAAQQIDTAAQARAAANTPRPASGDRAGAVADIGAARELLGESLPAGDWNALTSAFNQLDDEQRAAVFAALPADTRKFLSGMVDPSQPTPAFLPNLVAERTRPINDVDDLFAQRDAARAAGDQATVDSINSVLSGQGAAPQDEVTDAVRAAAERSAAVQSLRNAIIGTDPMYRAEQRRLLDASRPQPQPAVITPGARTPVFATDVPAAEMPTQFDAALAAAGEAQTRRDARTPGGGLSEADRLDAGQAASQRELPFFLRGRDRNDPFESRSRGSRGIEGNDLRAIEKATEMERQIESAQGELDAALADAAKASGVPAMAAAKSRVEQAEARVRAAMNAMDEAYPPRLVNPKTGQWKPYKGGEVPKGMYVERGRKAMAESRLNKGGQQETYDDLVLGMVGARPKPKRNLDRASEGLSSEDVTNLTSDAERVFGDDADEFFDVDFDDDWAVDPLDLETAGRPKKGRLGGQQQQSRIESAMQRMFGDTNPFELTTAEMDELGNYTAPLFASGEAVAEEILSKNTIFKPGTANYELAKSRIAQLVDRKFGSATRRNPRDAQFIPDDESIDAVANSATNLGDDAIAPTGGSTTQIGDATAADAPAPKKGGKRSSGRKKAEAETTAPATDAASEVAPINGRTKTVKEIQDEANEIEREARKAAIDEGMDVDDADAIARKARKDHVDREMAAQKEIAAKTGSGKPVTDAPPATATTNANAGDSEVKPTQGATVTDEVSSVTDNLDASATEIDGTIQPNTTRTQTYNTGTPPADEAPGSTVRTKQYDVGDQDQPPKTNTDGGTQKAAPPATKPSWMKRILVGGGIAGGIAALNNMTRPSGPFQLPPGVGPAGGAGPQDVPVSFPPGAAGMGEDSMDDTAAAVEVERLTRALNRVRGQQAMNPSEASQTLLNYNAGYR